jgi:uncharacterized protein (TIGR02147 family)
MDNETLEKVFDYDNYRFFLRDFFREQKRLKTVFSHRYFARRAGFSSSSFCAHVIDGKRNLTAESLRKILKGLGLTGKAATYFESLVYYNQAHSVDDREHFFRRLERLRKSTQFYKVNHRQFAYYDEWYYPVVRELAVYGTWRGDFAALGRLVRPAISAEKARKAVETLLEVGLLARGPGETYLQPDTAVTAEDVPWNITRKTRKEFVLKAIEAMETLPVDKRHIAGTTVALSETTFRLVTERLDELRREILAAATEEDEVNGVYQVNLQAFPVSTRIQWKTPLPKGGNV